MTGQHCPNWNYSQDVKQQREDPPQELRAYSMTAPPAMVSSCAALSAVHYHPQGQNGQVVKQKVEQAQVEPALEVQL